MHDIGLDSFFFTIALQWDIQLNKQIVALSECHFDSEDVKL